MIDLSKKSKILTSPPISLKCDPYLAAANGIGAVLGLIGANQQSKTAQAINAANIAMQRETNAMNERLFHENMDWQTAERKDQNAVNWENTIKMFNIENAYNTPSQQVQRMIQAGLNPASLAGASSGGNGSSSAPVVGSSVGVNTPQMVSPHAEMYTAASQKNLENMQMIASSIGQLAGAARDSAQAKESLTLLNHRLRNLTLTNDQLEVQNDLLIEFGSKTKQAEFDLLTAEFAKKQSEIRLNDELTDTEKEKQLNLISESLLKDSERFLNKKELAAFDKKLQAYLDTAKANINLANKEAFEAETGGKRNLAQANLFREEAITQDSIRLMNDSITDLNKAREDFQKVDTEVAKRTKANRIQQEFEKLTNMRYLNDEMQSKVEIAKAQMEQAMYENDMKAFTYWSNFGFRILDTGINAVNAVKGLPVTPWTHSDANPDTFEEVKDNPVKYYDSDGNVQVKHQTTKKVYKGKYKRQ